MWAASRFCCSGVKPIAKTAIPLFKATVGINAVELISPVQLSRHQIVRKFVSSNSERISHALRRSKKGNPEAAFTIGRGAVAGAGAAGLAALCYYGLGLSKDPGIIQSSAYWPQYVKDRIKTTYKYVGGSIAISFAAACAALRSPAIMRIVASGALLPNLLLCGTLIANGILVNSIPYQPGFGAKQLSWITFSSLVGGLMAPLYFYGGPVILRAAWYTAGIVGGLSCVAICAPNEQFLKMGGLLAIGSGFVFASGIGAMLLPPTTTFGAGMHSFFMYGGLILFSALLMYNTQRIARTAESLPPDYHGNYRYDPVSMSLNIFMDIVNIFSRIVFMIGGSNRKH